MMPLTFAPFSLDTLPGALIAIFTGLFAVLVLASAIGFVLARRASSQSAQAVVNNLNARTNAWWVMILT
ncbi:MAG: hypothetical protein EOP50_19500, partial [Sphingobacteriales bacterium]